MNLISIGLWLSLVALLTLSIFDNWADRQREAKLEAALKQLPLLVTRYQGTHCREADFSSKRVSLATAIQEFPEFDLLRSLDAGDYEMRMLKPGLYRMVYTGANPIVIKLIKRLGGEQITDALLILPVGQKNNAAEVTIIKKIYGAAEC